MNMWFECVYRNIFEIGHEWIECFCQKDGRRHNPYSPRFNIECENYRKESAEDGQCAEN